MFLILLTDRRETDGLAWFLGREDGPEPDPDVRYRFIHKTDGMRYRPRCGPIQYEPISEIVPSAGPRYQPVADIGQAVVFAHRDEVTHSLADVRAQLPDFTLTVIHPSS